jgi:hypothetical protein
MLVPPVDPRIEEHGDRLAFGIDAGQIRTFVQIAIDAGQREILQPIAAAMFLWPHVLDMQNREGRVALMKLTVLASIFRPRANERLSGFVDQCAARSENRCACRSKIAVNLFARTYPS